MNWLGALGAGVCAALLTGLIAGTAAGLCADWMRLPNREGALGFFAVAMTLFGALVGLLLAIALARGWLGVTAGFGKALGLTVASVLVVSLVVTGLVRLTADLNPEIDGRELDLFVELRYPPDTKPATGDDAYITFVRRSNGSTAGYARLDVENARDADGQSIVPAKLRIATSAQRKLLNARLSANRNLYFDLGFGAKLLLARCVSSKPRPRHSRNKRSSRASHRSSRPGSKQPERCRAQTASISCRSCRRSSRRRASTRKTTC